ncbi:reverse transcriptase family protein [Roseateles chitinivorans]|uniref:reverse transcriptase family protein n=1 Tax=Roseateles chitinivorans TaxID=2917965 RepID=UPI003D66D2AB
MQAWLASHVLTKIPVHPASKAFRPGDSIRACAAEHAEARWLIKLDIADFFGSITEIQVFRAFAKMGYNRLVAMELARLCTDTPQVSDKYRLPSWQSKKKWHRIADYSHGVLGRLPQGAPSSPMLANIAVADIDETVAAVANRYGLTYTRYSDDITLSTRGDFTRARAARVIAEVAKVLKGRGLFLNRRKTSVTHPGARRVVLGLLVDGEEPRLTKAFRDKLRQHLYYLETRGIAAHMAARSFDSAGGLYRHLRGLIDYANSVDSVYAEGLRARLDALPWGG